MWIYENHLDSETCREIIRRFEEDSCLQYPGEIATSSGAGELKTDVKKCTELHVSAHAHWADIDKILWERMGDAVKLVRAEHAGLAYMGGKFHDEGYRIKRYINDGIEQFKTHVDVNGYATAHRQLICQWYLNTVEEGGETVFHEQNVAIKPVEGRLACFPPFWTHIHTANPPISEPKYIVSGWLTFLRNPGPKRDPKEITYA
jgi:hypothetical protein